MICQYLATNRKLTEKPQEKIDAIFLKGYIDKSIDMYKIILDLSEEKVMEIRKEISIELIPKIIKNSITMDEIDKILAEKISING